MGIVLGAAYLLWLFQRTMLGPIRYDANRTLIDLSLLERLVALPLVVLMFAIGLYPAPLFQVLKPAVNALLGQIHQPRP
jgi:NADH-quinone oxidoreductase subunit M